MLADPNAELARALGLASEPAAPGFFVRSKRYSAVVQDGTITHLNLADEGGMACTLANVVYSQV
jgi:peroxiredoxin